jgi:hypothetical protein
VSRSYQLRRRAALWLAAVGAIGGAACASGAVIPKPVPAPTNGPVGAQNGPPLVRTTWPVRTREHVDLWLHTYAMLTTDSTLVPYFERGYRERMMTLRRQRGVSDLLEVNRAKLLERIAVQPSLATGPQFIPFYFASWDQMRQVIDMFLRANGNPRSASDQNQQIYFSVLAASFQTAPDREWLRMFAETADDESRKYYHEYWNSESRARARLVTHADSLWQREWRPALQRFLNNTQQQNGEVYLSLPLDGEGRTVHFGKIQNAVGVPMPKRIEDTESVLYVFAHEAAGAVASTAIEDNTTPAERRTGASARYEQSAAVRAGALLLERTIPGAVVGYMRYYLQSAGRPAPADPRAAFTTTFEVPVAVGDAVVRQLDVILGGI